MDLHRAPPAEGHALPAAMSSHEPGDLTDVGVRVGPIRTGPGRLTEQAGVRSTATSAKHRGVMTTVDPTRRANELTTAGRASPLRSGPLCWRLARRVTLRSLNDRHIGPIDGKTR